MGEYTCVHDARVASGLTQADIAKLLGMTQQKYSKIERNPEKCSVETALAIADILKCDVKIFLNKNTQ